MATDTFTHILYTHIICLNVKQDWESMTEAEQKPWNDMVAAARSRRHDRAAEQRLLGKCKRGGRRPLQSREEVQEEENVDNPDARSLWGCGNKRGVVCVDVLKDYANQFTNIKKLVSHIEECHDPSRLGGMYVPDRNTDYNTATVAAWKKTHMHCRHYHPGMCRTRDADVFVAAHQMFLKLQGFLGGLKNGIQPGDLLRFKCGEHGQCAILYFWLGLRLGNPRRQVFVATSNDSGPTELMPCSVEIVFTNGGALQMVHAHGLMMQLLKTRPSSWEVAAMEFDDKSLKLVKATRVRTKAIVMRNLRVVKRLSFMSMFPFSLQGKQKDKLKNNIYV